MAERTIFMIALEKDDPAERTAYLSEACAGDPRLRQRVEALLKSHDDAGSFLEAPIGEQMADHTEAVEPAPGPNADKNGETQAEPVGRVSNPSHPSPELDFLAPPNNPGSLGRLDHYEILAVIGRGGMGVVLKAFDEVLQRVVAVKVLAPQLATNATARKRFVREAQAGAAVCHDHVVTIHAVDEGKAVPYLVMQCVAGMSLQEKLDRDGPLGLKEILRIGMQTAEGLAAAHKQGLVHRDIKPANILLENGIERVKITDFGLARAVDDASVTQSGVITGTPQYMSPEQAHGWAVDHRSDLFSLGSVLYAMCTGRPPFRASGSMAVLKRVCEDTPRPIREVNPDIPDWLSDIIAKLHAKNAGDRFQSATEVAELLSQHLARLQQPTLVPALIQVGGEKQPATQSVSLLTPTEKRRLYGGIAGWFVLVISLGILSIICYSYLGVVWGGLVSVSAGALGMEILLCWVLGWKGRRKRAVIEVIIVLAIGGVLFDYKPPVWWKELWTHGGQTQDDLVSVVIKWDDPKLLVTLDSETMPYLRGMPSPVEMLLAPDTYTLRARKDGQLVYEEQIILPKGETRREIDLSVLLKQHTGSDRRAAEFEQPVAAKEQVEAVLAKLKALNPGFDDEGALLTEGGEMMRPLGGKVWAGVHGGVVRHFVIVTDRVTDISPVRAFTGLWGLGITARKPGMSTLTDLAPLRGLPLVEILCDFEPWRDTFVLRSIKTLKTINGEPADTFWGALAPTIVSAADCLVRGQELGRAGKWTEAEAEFKQATDLRPDDPHVWKWRGVIQAEGKQFEQAAVDFNKALDLSSPKWRTWWTNHGGIDETLFRWNEVFGRVRDLRRNDPNLWIALARRFARSGSWKLAAQASAEVLKRAPDDAENWFMDAALRLQIGDADGYRRDCREILRKFGQTDSPRTADQVAKTCLLLPAPEELGRVVELADRALAAPKADETYPWYAVCRALVHYRAGEYGRVANQLGMVLSGKPPFASIEATARVILAITLWQTDQKAAARAELEKARALRDKLMPQPDQGERYGDDWHDWLRCQVLLREAERVVK